MTDILSDAAAQLRALAASDPDQHAAVRATCEAPGTHGLVYLLGRGIPYPVLIALPAPIIDAVAAAYRDHAPAP